MQEIKINKKQFFLILIFSFLSFFGYFLLQNLDSRTKIVFCNVGQGDATYIRVKNKVDVLIDAGPDKKVLNCLGKYMPFWDKTIEIAFLSHPNKDHYQGFLFINERYKIKKFITVEHLFTNQGYKRLIENLKKNRITISKKFQGDKIKVFDTFFLFLWPEKNYFSSNDNDYSHILLFEENQFKVLFTGDASPKTLNLIIKTNYVKFIKNIKIIKVPHHGSKSGLNKNFLSVINPQIAVISVGKNNPYGHPSQEVLEMLKAKKVKIKRTDIEDHIVFKLPNLPQ